MQGLVSYANGPCLVFGSLKELKEKQTFKDTHNVVLAAQTTQEREEFEAIKKTLAEGHSLSVLETICDATRRRQQEALMISQQAETRAVWPMWRKAAALRCGTSKYRKSCLLRR